jgi:hypothetical protein
VNCLTAASLSKVVVALRSVFARDGVKSVTAVRIEHPFQGFGENPTKSIKTITESVTINLTPREIGKNA